MVASVTMYNHRVDLNGGFIGLNQPITLTDIDAGANGAATIKDWPAIHTAQGSPRVKTSVTTWAASISGVTGADEESINGARTMTRTGDQTFDIGVDTTLLTYVATAATVDIAPMDLNSSTTPRRAINDFT